VHFTKRIGGGIEAGPNAVLALAREGYTKTRVSGTESAWTLGYGGFWRMAAKYWRTGAHEMYRSFSKAAFTRSLQRLVPAIRAGDLEAGGAGVRAQAVDRTGRLVDDFRVVADGNAVHVLNAPSPGATASLAIGAGIVDMARQSFALGDG
jgi:L-2-hydroxyglutarate oxidase